MFSHPGPREEGHHFSANEIIMAAENQLLAGDEKMQSPFVTVKVTLNAENNSDFQACQMSRQCLELVAEGALLNDPQEPRACLVHDTFSCLVQGERKKGGKEGEGGKECCGGVVGDCGGGGGWWWWLLVCVGVCFCLLWFTVVVCRCGSSKNQPSSKPSIITDTSFLFPSLLFSPPWSTTIGHSKRSQPCRKRFLFGVGAHHGPPSPVFDGEKFYHPPSFWWPCLEHWSLGPLHEK